VFILSGRLLLASTGRHELMPAALCIPRPPYNKRPSRRIVAA
jgi:hypothetical protein